MKERVGDGGKSCLFRQAWNRALIAHLKPLGFAGQSCHPKSSSRSFGAAAPPGARERGSIEPQRVTVQDQANECLSHGERQRYLISR